VRAGTLESVARLTLARFTKMRSTNNLERAVSQRKMIRVKEAGVVDPCCGEEDSVVDS
jgi:hypothetical protein